MQGFALFGLTTTAPKPPPASKGSGVKPHAAQTQYPLAQCSVHTATKRVTILVDLAAR